MADLQEIKKEIINTIKNRYPNNYEKKIEKVEEELHILETTEGLENKNNLESFYNIWKMAEGAVYTENKINSWTACFLGFTKTKPKGEFLPVRRAFARAGFPDIDTDFDDIGRDKVYAYIIDKYGRENVGNIGTHGKLKFKSCVTRVAKALDVANTYHRGQNEFVSGNAAKVTEILSPFPKKGLIRVTDEVGESHIINNFEEAYEHCVEFRSYVNRYNSSGFKDHISNIEGSFANFGYHAAGIVVSDVPLNEIAPLRTAKKGVLATQFPNEDLEALGLIKFDVLSISTLSVIKRTVDMVKDYWNIEVDLENLPMDDEPTLALYRAGNLGGVFQCENYGMQKTMREIGVDRFEDVIAGLALYRPGPMDSIPQYCARKKGEEPVSYFHRTIEPHVKPYLERTYGVLAYQEQVMQICNALAGFTITDGYVMIKAIGKKKQFLMEKFSKQFIEGCVNKGVPQDVAVQYWEKFITPFASYGFNLSHSACYAYNSYTTAYLKANYPDEFMTSLFNVAIQSDSGGDRYDKVEAFEKEFKRKMGIKILPRDVNKCKIDYVIEKRKDSKNGILKTEIRPSLLCKGLGKAVAIEVENNQPYADMRDFVEKANIGVGVVEALARGGYLKSICKKKNGEEDESYVLRLIEDFKIIREDNKRLAVKGIESCDLFAGTY
jgi:DNA polymerase III subunit alpha